MYGREYGEKVLNFEASGGLIHYSLIMADKETDSYWSIMTDKALAGEFSGSALEKLPIGVKTQWKDWVAEHPKTKVLSVDGKEHVENNPYDNYFTSEEGFRGSKAKDERLPTKESIYAFELGGKAYAAPLAGLEGGTLYQAGDQEVFLYRPEGAEIFYSTLAFVAPKGSFEQKDGTWTHSSGTAFDADSMSFPGASLEALAGGFDTFWFNWSMYHPETEILGSPE